ncbi:MAG: alpha/beta hydrolase, partial [Bacteroidota bacterium]
YEILLSLSCMTPIQFSHANGFPAASYRTFFEALAPHPVHAVPAFGMGDFQIKRDWWPLADELIAHIESHGNYPVVGIGHSLGGMVTLWAAMKRPDLFTHIILMDPPALGFVRRFFMHMARSVGILDQLPTVVKKAKNRKDHFKDKAEAFSYWKGKSLFRNFDPQAFQDYVDAGLTPHPRDGYTLTIPRELEAQIFSSIPFNFQYRPLPQPAFYILPEHTVLSPKEQKEVVRVFKDFTFIRTEGGHLFPLENPPAAADLIKGLIQ